MSNKPVYSTRPLNKLWLFSVASALVLLALGYWSFSTVSYTAPSVMAPEVAIPPLATVSNPVLPPIYFTGDVMLGRHVETLIDRNLVHPYDFYTLFATSTAVVTNFESAMADPHIPTPSGAMRFSVKPSSLTVLDSLNITHASLANNHARDYGQVGYQHAVRELSSRSITPFGDAVTLSTSSLAYVRYGDTTIGLIGLHTLFVPPDEMKLGELIQLLATTSDIQIAYVHWGEEYELVANQAQANLVSVLQAQGIDIVIGHHPHVTQNIDMVAGIPVFYSLGNFIFDQYFSTDVQQGLVLGLTIELDTVTITLHPHEQCARATPCLMSSSTEKVYLEALAQRSNSSLREQIMAKKLTFSR